MCVCICACACVVTSNTWLEILVRITKEAHSDPSVLVPVCSVLQCVAMGCSVLQRVAVEDKRSTL